MRGAGESRPVVPGAGDLDAAAHADLGGGPHPHDPPPRNEVARRLGPVSDKAAHHRGGVQGHRQLRETAHRASDPLGLSCPRRATQRCQGDLGRRLPLRRPQGVRGQHCAGHAAAQRGPLHAPRGRGGLHQQPPAQQQALGHARALRHHLHQHQLPDVALLHGDEPGDHHALAVPVLPSMQDLALHLLLGLSLFHRVRVGFLGERGGAELPHIGPARSRRDRHRV
mmetsp:Transcript_32442/g.93404  ORF Transcript_32442/g.93404 Transcript_32442/m.93404 type:complete len:225 (-) Transcript_32442:269-943(-)